MKPKYHFRPNGEVIVIPDGDDRNTPLVVGTYKKHDDTWFVCISEFHLPGWIRWDWVFNHDNVPKHIRAMALLFK